VTVVTSEMSSFSAQRYQPPICPALARG